MLKNIRGSSKGSEKVFYPETEPSLMHCPPSNRDTGSGVCCSCVGASWSEQGAQRCGRHPVSLGGDPMSWVAGGEQPHLRRLLQPVNRPRSQATNEQRGKTRRQVACDPLQSVLPPGDTHLLTPRCKQVRAHQKAVPTFRTFGSLRAHPSFFSVGY